MAVRIFCVRLYQLSKTSFSGLESSQVNLDETKLGGGGGEKINKKHHPHRGELKGVSDL